jgi:hypothetical protein
MPPLTDWDAYRPEIRVVRRPWHSLGVLPGRCSHLSSSSEAGTRPAIPEAKWAKARAVTEPLREETGMAALDTETVVRVNGCVQIVAGVLLAIGKVRRLACLFLMGSLIPTTYAGHRFSEETDETARSQQRTHFLKNIGLLGGQSGRSPIRAFRASPKETCMGTKDKASNVQDLKVKGQGTVGSATGYEDLRREGNGAGQSRPSRPPARTSKMHSRAVKSGPIERSTFHRSHP